MSVRMMLAVAVGGVVAVLGVAIPASAPASAGLPAAAPVGPAGPVLPPLGDDTATAPSSAGVERAVGAALTDASLGSSVGVSIVDGTTGVALYSQEPASPRPTASTDKVLTAVSVLHALGPESRLTTTVTWDPASSTLTLVGAGDPTLATVSGDGSSLTALADQVVAALPTGSGTVSLHYDVSLFSGPALGPGWPAAFPALGIAAPVSALLVDGARSADGVSRQDDPALAAATVFAGLLSDRGVTTAPPSEGGPLGSVIASTRSVPIAAMVEVMLTESDNDMAESLAHLAGATLSGTGSFESGAAATLSALTTLGVSTAGATIRDGSGLSMQDQVPPRLLSDVLVLLAGPTAPTWAWSVFPGLPIAGLTGTLSDRFLAADTFSGAGTVRAKTGTLDGVSTLAGTVVDDDGHLIVFALMADQVGDVTAARAGLDRVAANLASCGCE